MSDVTRLVYKAKTTGDQFIDLTQGLAFANGRNYTQFKDGKPQLVAGSIRLANAGHTVSAAKNSWVVKNACVKANAAWSRTLRSAGIRNRKKLNTYARELRLAYDANHTAVWGGYNDASTGRASLVPENTYGTLHRGVAPYADLPVGGYPTGQYDKDGNEVKIYSFALLDGTGHIDFSDRQNQHAFTQTTAAVPQSGSTDVKDKKFELLNKIDAYGPSATSLIVTAEYIDSRINEANIEDTDMDETPSNDNDFVMMLAPGEEVADDVLDLVEDEGKWRPYFPDDSYQGTDLVTAGANVAGQDTDFVAPLGLLKWTPSSVGDLMVIDVMAMGDM